MAWSLRSHESGPLAGKEPKKRTLGEHLHGQEKQPHRIRSVTRILFLIFRIF